MQVRNGEGEQVRGHIPYTGLVFTTTPDDAPVFRAFFPGLRETLKRVDSTKRFYRRSVKYDGHFNWKTVIDGYQESLNWQYIRPSFSALYLPTSYSVHVHYI